MNYIDYQLEKQQESKMERVVTLFLKLFRSSAVGLFGFVVVLVVGFSLLVEVGEEEMFILCNSLRISEELFLASRTFGSILETSAFVKRR